MDKEFEEWYSKPELPYIEYDIAKLIWNASKQYWLDKAVEVVESGRTSQLKEPLIKKIKELKE